MPVQFLDTPNAVGSLAGAAAGYLLSNPARKAEQAKNEYAQKQDTIKNKSDAQDLAIRTQAATQNTTKFNQDQDHETLRKGTLANIDKQIPEPKNADPSTPEGLALLQKYYTQRSNAWMQAGFPDEAKNETDRAYSVSQSYLRGTQGAKDTAQAKIYPSQAALNDAKARHIQDYEKDLGIILQDDLQKIGAQTDGKVKVASIQQAGAYARTHLQQEGATQRTGMTDDTKTAIANQTAALKLYDIQMGYAIKSDKQYYDQAKAMYHEDMVAWNAANKAAPGEAGAQPPAPGMPPAPGAMPAAPSIGIPTGGGNSGEPSAKAMAPIIKQFTDRGVPLEDAKKLARIAESESGGDPSQVESTTGSAGTMQINPQAHGHDSTYWKDPKHNYDEAVKLYNANKAKGGTGFSDWESSRNQGAYGGWGHSPEFTNGASPAQAAGPAPHPLARAGAAAVLAAKPENSTGTQGNGSDPKVQSATSEAKSYVKDHPDKLDDSGPDGVRAILKGENLSPAQIDQVMAQLHSAQKPPAPGKTAPGKPAAKKQALPKPAAPASPWAGVDSTRTSEDQPHQTNAGDVFNSIGRYFTGARDAKGELIPEKPNNTPGSQTPDSQGALSKLAMPIVVGELKKGTPAQAIVREMVQKHGFTLATAQAVVSQAMQQLKPAAPGSTWK
jgi:hypothetical protein